MFNYNKYIESLPSELDLKFSLSNSEYRTVHYLSLKPSLSLVKYPRYIVTRDSRIINKDTGKELKKHTDRAGYQLVYLRDGSKKNKGLLVHRIVISSFSDKQELLHKIETNSQEIEVNHRDYDKTNNQLDNLEWIDKLGNTRHAISGERYKQLLKPNQVIRVINGKRRIITIKESN